MEIVLDGVDRGLVPQEGETLICLPPILDVQLAIASQGVVLRAISQILCLPMSELLMRVPDDGWLAVVILVAQQGLWQLYDTKLVVPVTERLRISETHPLCAATV